MLKLLLANVDESRAHYLNAIHTAILYEVSDFWKTPPSEGSNKKLVAEMLVHRVLHTFTLTEYEKETLKKIAFEFIDSLPQ